MNACCPYCGAEYLLSEARCWDCKLSLVEPPAPTLGLDDPTDEAGYELDDWPASARSKLTASLSDRGIAARWEPGLILVVREADGDAVDDLLDELDDEEFPDDDGDGDEDDGSEAAHEAMGDLFVVADRLMHEPWDEGIGAELAEVSDRVAASPPPFGIDPVAWAQIQELAGIVVADLDAGATDDVVVTDARTLRDVLRRYV
ncbi:MAG: hypothetical protein M3O23_12065 [Actinomycetota bacterium]|nr:hypothetical protein [Actinomycetota bacterium]